MVESGFETGQCALAVAFICHECSHLQVMFFKNLN